MSVTTDRDRFFQTTASIAENERKQRKSANTLGDPIRFPSKLLALQVNHAFDPTGNVVFVAEAGGRLSAVKLSSAEVSLAGKPATAPLTSLTYAGSQPGATTQGRSLDVFTGGWDKNITRYTYHNSSGVDGDFAPVGQNSFPAHTDFVKCVAVVPMADKQQILVSGGADGEVNFWFLDGKRLATLRPNCRAIESIALDPFSSADAPVIFFSTSQREIFQVTLPSVSSLSGNQMQISPPIVVHETSVYKLFFDDDGDLWTASADKTAKHLSRENNWMADTTLTHPDFVRDVVVHSQTRLVVTACRDEEIRVWNGSTGQLFHVFAGHYEEITGLAITGNMLLSVSIDATLRRWSLAPADLQAEIEKAKNPNLLQEVPEPGTDELGMLTAEEEAELRALMEEEDSESLEKMAQDQQ